MKMNRFPYSLTVSHWQDKKYDIVHTPCKKCGYYKLPRVSHCSSCGTCIYKMDHHCVWAQNCIGYRNQRAFYLFCFYMSVGDIIFWHFSYMTYHQLKGNFFGHFPTSVYVWWGFTCLSVIFIGLMILCLTVSHLLMIMVNHTTLDSIKTKSFGSIPCCEIR